MKGDFSKWGVSPADNYSGVLHQQGRVLLDQDWNAAQQIQALWRDTAGKDIVGDGLVAIPTAAPDSLKLLEANATAAGVEIELAPGRGWVDGLLLQYAGATPLIAEYLRPPLQDPPFDVTTIAAGVRDAVVLEVWDEAISAFQLPKELLEPALGGPDTTERVKTSMALRLLRMEDGQECGDLDLDDDFASKGRLTVVPSPTMVVAGPCPVPDSGGYSGFEHALYRIEIASPLAGVARFKWSQFNGGLVGRGHYTAIDAVSGTVRITANDQMIDQCGLDSFHLEALAFDPAHGHWRTALTAAATLSATGTLSLTGVDGVWPTDDDGNPIGFFRLWNAIERIDAYPAGLPLANELSNNVGIRLAFDPPVPGRYTPGDYWTFPARVAGTDFDPGVWPNNAPPQGIRYHRAPLGVLEWTGPIPTTVRADLGQIHDCRQIFLPLARIKGCCTVTVGDGRHSFGQYRSIQAAVNALPAQGGTVCVLAGVYDESVHLHERLNIRIHGCGPRTRVRAVDDDGLPLPAFLITDSSGIAIEDMAIESGPRSAVQIHNSDHVEVRRCLIQMRDEVTIWQAIHSRGDDILIEGNTIEVLRPRDDRLTGVGIGLRPSDMLPPKLGMPNAPASVNTPPMPVYPGARTRGGIQIAGGSDRVRIAGNLIRGGIWNGITLGSLVEVGSDKPDDDVPDLPPGRDPCEPCAPVDLSDDDDQDPNRPRFVSAGDLYEIDIVDNRITDMGINGIGVVRYFDLARGGDMIGVHGLRIADNLIARCLRRDLANVKATMAMLIGYGGISLARVSDLRILRNEIVDNGTSHRFPVCGVFALMVQGLQLDDNRIVDNGPRDREPVEGIQQGIRGGVHIWLLMPIVEAHATGWYASANRAAGRRERNGPVTGAIRDNIIVAPVGRSLTCFALGPLIIARNRLVTQGTTGRGLDLLAATVLVGDLGLSNEWTPGLLVALILLLFGGIDRGSEQLCTFAVWGGLADFRAQPPRLWPPLVRRWATGKLLISENQITLDVIDEPLGVGMTSVLAFSLDDVALVDNQIEINSTSQFFVSANMLFGGSLRMSDNRLSETWMRAFFSGTTLGLMNTTTDNQSTHCLQAFAMDPDMRVFRDNLSLVEAFCPGRCDYGDPRG